MPKSKAPRRPRDRTKPPPPELPIIFKGEYVRATLEDRKTQTRRPVVLPRSAFGDWEMFMCNDGWPGFVDGGMPEERVLDVMRAERGKRCPFGHVGTRLWVREAFYCDHVEAAKSGTPTDIAKWSRMLYYRADYADDHAWAQAEEWAERTPPWTPSIHMPRWASRLTLDVTGVRVERLQNISEEDARAEGVDPAEWRGGPANLSHRAAFGESWSRLYPDSPWSDNPWVWVISFKRIEGTA